MHGPDDIPNIDSGRDHSARNGAVDPTTLGDDEIVSAIHRYTAPALTAGPIPAFGSAQWVALDDDDPDKAHAVTRGALAYWTLTQRASEDHAQADAAVRAARDRSADPVTHADLCRRRHAATHRAGPGRTPAQILADAVASWGPRAPGPDADLVSGHDPKNTAAGGRSA